GFDRGLCALESPRARRWRSLLAQPLGRGPARLAHRVQRHEHENSWAELRSPPRWRRPGLSPSRGRNRPERRRGPATAGPPFREVLGPRRPSARRRQEDEQIARQLLYLARSSEKRLLRP